MVNVEQYAAPTVYDPPGYAQAVKFTGADALLFISGQITYDENGNPAMGEILQHRRGMSWQRCRHK